jgi:hypothetical protein
MPNTVTMDAIRMAVIPYKTGLAFTRKWTRSTSTTDIIRYSVKPIEMEASKYTIRPNELIELVKAIRPPIIKMVPSANKTYSLPMCDIPKYQENLFDK